MVQAYWQVGRLIAEDEQGGATRAEYGKKVLEALSERLSEEFGKGFDVRNLRNMRSFYLAYPNRYALRTDLTWTEDIIGAWSVVMSITIDVLEFFRLFLLLTAGPMAA
jgi:hypothetical protein